MPFQRSTQIYPAPGVPGGRASLNPVTSVVAGPGNLTAGALGCVVGKFAWQSLVASTGVSTVNNFSPTAPTLPDGFVSNEQQALITAFLADHTLIVPPGMGVTLYDRGDFFAQSVYGEAVIGNKVFANLFSGDIFAAAAGSFLTNALGSNAAFTATVAPNTPGTGSTQMTVSAVASGVLQVGQQVSGPGIPFPTYIEALGTGSGNTGTYFLSQPATVTVGVAMTSVSPSGLGGFTGTASFATSVMTATVVTTGVLAVGQLVQAAGVAVGTYITSLGTGTGGLGTYNLSTTPGTIAALATAASSWIETPWYVKSPGNVGDVIVIGVRN